MLNTIIIGALCLNIWAGCPDTYIGDVDRYEYNEEAGVTYAVCEVYDQEGDLIPVDVEIEGEQDAPIGTKVAICCKDLEDGINYDNAEYIWNIYE